MGDLAYIIESSWSIFIYKNLIGINVFFFAFVLCLCNMSVSKIMLFHIVNLSSMIFYGPRCDKTFLRSF